MNILTNIAVYWWNFMNGKFGRYGSYELAEPYKTYWQWVMWLIFAALVIVYIVAPIMRWWEGVVAYINYVRWGIGGPIE